ncbi:shikimate kinase [Egicoccus halophilus]|uniref:Shikimate kinase n=1 Tax=Egicoccus halophilus TaxID=1670830 RepID=A0A8J3AFR3_9ACTN|nr:shikimate kinase [Egicoccus halophilus]GGI07057.1 shikimate kinase [Egicoccus halophilus]
MSGSDERERSDRHVVLVGMMGAGKTTTGVALAARLDRPLRDGDVDLEARTGHTGAEIAAADGIDHLHHLEEEVLLDALADERPAVVAAAGWVVEAPRCREALADRATVVWLDVPVGELVSRMATGAHRRPLDPDAADALLARRQRCFAEAADLRLDARAPVDELVASVLDALDEADDRSTEEAP